jgi:hypothetical protein
MTCVAIGLTGEQGLVQALFPQPRLRRWRHPLKQPLAERSR